MFIRSERLFLRPSWPEDWSEIYAGIADEAVVRNLALAPWPYTIEDAIGFARREQERLLPHFLITLPGAQGSQVIGCVSLARKPDEVELGYWIARSYWSRGYASEAVRAVLRLADALGHRRIMAHHFADNPASGKVLAKAGFRPTGQQSLRFSKGRGQDALAIGYVREIDGDCNQHADRLMRAA